jgi:riboflavin biosynthesis pyrimidine reductase
MISTLDGAATGESGTSGSINNAADKQVFDHLRASADAILVGAGTARVEGYRPSDTPIVVVSRHGAVPAQLRGAPEGSVLLATRAEADQLDAARHLLGERQVLVAGSDEVDLPRLKEMLADRGWGEVLCEGGPRLLHGLLASGVVDEICATLVPRLVAGEHPRIVNGPSIDVSLRLHHLHEADDSLLGRWIVETGTRTLGTVVEQA